MSGDIELSGEDYHALLAERDRLAAELAETVERADTLQEMGIGACNDLSAEREAHARTRLEDAQHMRRLLNDVRYMEGIAVRGFGKPTPEDEPIRAYVLRYVKHVEDRADRAETENARLAAELAEAQRALELEVVHSHTISGTINNTLLAEREAHARTKAVVAQVQWFIEHERACRDAIGKGGQHVNGEAPRITPSVLQELERMLRDAPDVAAGYAKAEARANRAEAVLRELRAWLTMPTPRSKAMWSHEPYGNMLAKLDELEREVDK